MPQELMVDDLCLTRHEAWQSATKKMQSREMVTFVNTSESEEGYPFLKSELCNLHLFKHKVEPNVRPQAPSIVSEAFGNFMYSKLVDNEDLILRRNSLQALEVLCHMSYHVRYELIRGDQTLHNILKIIKGERDIKCIIWALEVLSQCISSGNYDDMALEKLLKVDAVPTALFLIQSPFREVQESSCRFLCLLCMHKEGKRSAITERAVDLLVPMLSDIEPRVQAFACAALCCITIEIQGKKDYVICKGIPIISKLLDLNDEQLCLYDITLMINVAEYPLARIELFKDTLVRLRSIVKESTSPLLKKRAKLGLQQLHFKHLPHVFPYDKMDNEYLQKMQSIDHKVSLPPDVVLQSPSPVSPSFSPTSSGSPVPKRPVRHTI